MPIRRPSRYKAPEIKMHVLNEGDLIPESLDVWSIVIKIEAQKDYYPTGAAPDKENP